MPDVVDPKPYLEYGALGVALLLTLVNLTFFAWMTTKHFAMFQNLIPILESVKGNVKALQELVREAKEHALSGKNNRGR